MQSALKVEPVNRDIMTQSVSKASNYVAEDKSSSDREKASLKLAR